MKKSGPRLQNISREWRQSDVMFHRFWQKLRFHGKRCRSHNFENSGKSSIQKRRTIKSATKLLSRIFEIVSSIFILRSCRKIINKICISIENSKLSKNRHFPDFGTTTIGFLVKFWSRNCWIWRWVFSKIFTVFLGQRDPCGSHDKIRPWSYDLSGSHGKIKAPIHDPSGSHNKLTKSVSKCTITNARLF